MEEQLENFLKGRKFRKMLDQFFYGIRKDHDLKFIEIEILLYIDLYRKAHASDICRSLELNKGHVSQALRNLCRKELLTADSDRLDARSVCYDISEKGEKIIAGCKRIHRDLIAELTAGISENELIIMENTIRKMEKNMDRIMETACFVQSVAIDRNS